MARTYDGVTIERDALKEILTALNIGYEALIEYENISDERFFPDEDMEWEVEGAEGDLPFLYWTMD